MKIRPLIVAAVLLLLPTLVLTSIVIKHELGLKTARTWRVKITGYDPRDLLLGHYLNFQFNWALINNSRERACASGEECCLCLNPVNGVKETPVPQISYQLCANAKKRCVSFIPVAHLHNLRGFAFEDPSDVFDPESGQRYFVPEKSAPILEKILRSRAHEVSLDLKVLPSGLRMLGELYIDNTPWREWLSKHPNEAE
jgi:uncharacterized membrane-anchored protein